jgi:hypothetical protein
MQLDLELAARDLDQVDELRRRAAVVDDEDVGLRRGLAQEDEGAQEHVEVLRCAQVDRDDGEAGEGAGHMPVVASGGRS